MIDTPAAHWPAGHRATLVLTFDVDGEYGEIQHHGSDDWYWRSHAQYDLRTGIWRGRRLLEDFDVPATFCWVGRAAEDRPDAVTAAYRAGHEIATHGWDHQAYTNMSADEQRADIIQTRDTIQHITGERPTGHKTPFWRFNEHTVGVLQELGFSWNMDIANDDVPYLMRPSADHPPLVQLPPSRLWDDYSFFVDPVTSPGQAFESWREDIDVIRAEGKMMVLTLHPWVIGRPGPSRTLAMFLDYVVALGDVWIARADRVAQAWVDAQESLESG